MSHHLFYNEQESMKLGGEGLIYLILLQIKQIVPFWVLGLSVGAVVTAYKDRFVSYIPYETLEKGNLLLKLFLAALIGAASPITIYGMLPILAALARFNARQSVIAAFVISSILINPNVFIFTFSLGGYIAVLRLLLSILAGVTAGLLAETIFKKKAIFNLDGFCTGQAGSRQNLGNIKTVAANFKRAVFRTAPNLALGIVLAALFQLYFPRSVFSKLFGSGSGLGVLFAASLGVTAYYCGGGTIPLILAWMNEGMSLGSALTYMLTGPAMKLTNLAAVKTIMPVKHFSAYLAFNIAFGIAAGLFTDFIVTLV